MTTQVDYMTTKLKKSDVFGHDFKMTFNGEKFYTTWCGTLMSTMLNVVTLFYACALFVDVWNEKATSMTTDVKWFDINDAKY